MWLVCWFTWHFKKKHIRTVPVTLLVWLKDWKKIHFQCTTIYKKSCGSQIWNILLRLSIISYRIFLHERFRFVAMSRLYNTVNSKIYIAYELDYRRSARFRFISRYCMKICGEIAALLLFKLEDCKENSIYWESRSKAAHFPRAERAAWRRFERARHGTEHADLFWAFKRLFTLNRAGTFYIK